MRSLLRFLLVAVVVLAACGDDDEPVSADGSSTTPPTAGDDDLNSIEGEYIATEITEGGEPRALVADTQIRLTLRQGTLGANAGCNSIGGDYRIDDGVLHVEALAMTEMGCDPPRHEQDDWLADFLSSSPGLRPVEEGFVLSTDTTTMTFVDHSVVEPDLDLVGTQWTVDTYLEGTGADGTASASSGPMGVLTFGEDGSVSGNDGCNDFDGLSYEVDGDTIAFSGTATTTDMACADVETDTFWRVLEGTVTWDIESSRLTLEHPDGFGLAATGQR